jgi:hypothetical protein
VQQFVISPFSFVLHMVDLCINDSLGSCKIMIAFSKSKCMAPTYHLETSFGTHCI